MINRDDKGHATIRTLRLPSPINLDGKLDEAFYTVVKPISDFIQLEPHEGAPATEKTEVWVFFDDKNVYVSARMFETDSQKRVTSDMRRDSNNMYNNAANQDRVAPSSKQSAANMQKADRAGKGPNNVYADKSGNVQRQTSQGGWQSQSNGSWNSSQNSSRNSSNNMNRDAQARQSGANRSSSSYSGSRGSSGGSRGGGGGGRRR